MNKPYREPDAAVLGAELARAGADENGQIAGAIWIHGAVRGIALPKLSAGEASKLKQLRDALDKCTELMGELPHCIQTWLEDEVTKPVHNAAEAVGWTLRVYPGGHSQQAHLALANALNRYFKAEGLPVAFGAESPFVRIFAHCAGMDADVARTTLGRLLDAKQISTE